MYIGMVFLKISVLVLLQRWVGRRWLAIGLALLVWIFLGGAGSLTWLLIYLGGAGLTMFALLRWGVLAMVMTEITIEMMWYVRAVDYGHWISQGAVYGLVLMVAFVLYGVWASTGRSVRAVAQR